jgi:hypothetical protein
MRCDQYIGLPDRADELIDGLISEETGEKFDGMYVEHDLMQYREPSELDKLVREIYHLIGEKDFRKAATLCDQAANASRKRGRVLFREKNQCSPWSSGPCHFLKLVDAEGNDVCSWSDEEIDSQL